MNLKVWLRFVFVFKWKGPPLKGSKTTETDKDLSLS
jgi:hypothetical protein